jgi:OOP family OmpA-OmpF porin
MRKTLLSCIAALSLAATSLTHAAHPGTYAGLGLGWSKQETSRNLELAPNANQSGGIGYKTDRDQLGARIFAGYNFNENFGIESGLAQYGKSKYKQTVGTGNGVLEHKMQAFDVVGKGYLPVGDGFNVYALGGLALVHAQVKNSNVSSTDASYSKTQNRVRPIYGIGASYDIPQTQLTTNLEFSRIQGSGNLKTSKSAIPSADMLTLNIAYNFN